MKIIGSLYEDKHGNIWLLKAVSLPKKKGEYKFWTAEQVSEFDMGGLALRDDKKSILLKKISEL